MKLTLGVFITLLALVAPVAAHHGWTIDYDNTKPVTVKGTLTKVEWTNPHIHLYLESKDDNGTVTEWNFEMASPLALQRHGWTRKTLPPGTEMTVTGFSGRAVANRAVANGITLADGKELFVAPPGQ